MMNNVSSVVCYQGCTPKLYNKVTVTVIAKQEIPSYQDVENLRETHRGVQRELGARTGDSERKSQIDQDPSTPSQNGNSIPQ